jgi:hypothetical protein
MAINDFIPKFLDPYDRPARLYPGLLVIAPVAVQIVCLYGTDNTAFSSVLTILGFCGIAYVLGRIARNAGKRLQDRLFNKWGGAPTTQLLRHRDTRIDIHTKERFHRVLSKGLGKGMPTHDDERNNPAAADELYRAATVWLIIQTRDMKAFPLIFKENVAFGFHRNALGLRPLGASIASLCILWILHNAKIIAFTAPFFSARQALGFTPEMMVSLSISTGILVAWTFVFTEDALKRTGFSYAEQLLQSCDQLKSSSRRSGG